MGIEDLRAEIDDIDRKLILLLNERARIAVEVGAMKKAAALPVYDPAREQKVLDHVRQANVGPLDDRAITELFCLIIRESRRVETRHVKATGEVIKQ
ncbi:MAG: chorismate mutase [Pyrinomonadaceae bacterium]